MKLRATCVMVCVAMLAVLAGCGSSSNSSSSAKSSGQSGASTSGATSTTGAATQASGGITAATKQLIAQYTGLTPGGKVNPSLKPVTIGYVNQEGSDPAFPEDTLAANAVIKVINADFGGIDGHALAMDKCIIQTEEDGQKCGVQLVNAKVPMTEYGLSVVGSASFHKTVGTSFPTIIGSPSEPTDSTAPDTFVLGGGGASVLDAMMYDAKYTLKSPYTSVVTVNNPGGVYSAQSIAIPYANKIGLVHSKSIYYPEGATSPQVVSALQAAGAFKAGAIVIDPSAPLECISVFNAIKSLSLKAKVIATPECNASTFIKATAPTGPEGWLFAGYGTNPRVTTNPQAAAFANILDSYGAGSVVYTGFTPQIVRDWLTIAKWAKAIGPTHLTPAAFLAQIKAFKGPAFMTPGLLHCGKPTFAATPTYCGDWAALSEYSGGKWSELPPFKLTP
jgi:branched-chain amino acid transport system substrate-binding protein